MNFLSLNKLLNWLLYAAFQLSSGFLRFSMFIRCVWISIFMTFCGYCPIETPSLAHICIFSKAKSYLWGLWHLSSNLSEHLFLDVLTAPLHTFCYQIFFSHHRVKSLVLWLLGRERRWLWGRWEMEFWSHLIYCYLVEGCVEGLGIKRCQISS